MNLILLAFSVFPGTLVFLRLSELEAPSSNILPSYTPYSPAPPAIRGRNSRVGTDAVIEENFPSAHVGVDVRMLLVEHIYRCSKSLRPSSGQRDRLWEWWMKYYIIDLV